MNLPHLQISVQDNTRRGVRSASKNLTTLKDKAQAATRSMGKLGTRGEKTGVQFAQSAMKMAGFTAGLASVGFALKNVISTVGQFEGKMARIGSRRS